MKMLTQMDVDLVLSRQGPFKGMHLAEVVRSTADLQLTSYFQRDLVHPTVSNLPSTSQLEATYQVTRNTASLHMCHLFLGGRIGQSLTLLSTNNPLE